MSLFGGGGFGQQNNQQQQGTGFGGFGSNNNTGTGFGQQANAGFGATPNNTGGGLFGGSPNTGFGSGGTGFGSGNTASPFGGNRSGFGATTNTTSGGGLFGSNTATSGPSTGFGGFGSNANNANSGGGMFGATNKPAFGAQNNTGGSLFGGGAGNNTFGQNNNQNTGAFGNTLGAALGTSTTECQGTGSTPFQVVQEKDNPAGTTTNHYQSVTFMQPYKNFCFEELRLADYNQGRRFGNGSGQAGAFGFSGFGGQTSNATSNPFGAQPANTSSPFGGGQTNNAFGNTNTGGSLFGQANKPATGGLFGNNAPTPQPSGGLFGTSNNTNAGFGGFGNQQQEQPKAGFSFGNTNPSTGFGSGGTGFGSNNTNTNTNTGGGLFGNTNNNQPNTGFGNNQQQQPASNPFGGFGANAQNQNQSNTNPAFGGFGQNNQQKPGGLFGNNPTTNTTGGLFGGTPTNQQQQPAGGLFGNNNNNNTQQSGTSLFGKPASTGTSLFGNNNATSATNPGTSLFGAGLDNNNANQGQQNQGGGLFGNNNNQQQQQPGGLFATSNSTGGGLFGSNNNQQQPAGGSLFGPTTSNNQQQQQQQPGGLFGSSNNNTASVLNTSQQQQNALAPPQTLTASLLDRYPYGSASIFDGLPPPPQASPVPMATPINGTKTIRKSAIPPTYKINPTQSTSRLVTPRRHAGYGFTYSTYGTPSSAASNISTPGGFSSSLLHSSISRGLGKSLSTSNLRRSFDSDGESLLSPGAFSAGSSRYSGGGSLKRLNIDRSLRTDLFGNGGAAALPSPDKSDQSRQPGILKKKVSFDTNTVGGNENGENGTVTNGTTAIDSNNSAQPSAQEQGFLRSSRGGNKFGGAKVNGISSQPEMEQVKGNELAIVHEDGPPETTAPSEERLSSQVSHEDPQPGEYYMRPSKADIDKMSREQKSRVTDFEVGREGCGHAVFNEPVDLNSVNLEDIPDKIAQITLRSLTIYPDSTNKPPVGMGLNVPSTIYLENSWPRQRDRKAAMYEKSGPRFNRHLEKLRKVPGTDFVSYNADTGVWVFTVPHFTTYALEYEDTASEGDTLQMSTINSDQNTPTPKLRHVQGGSGSSKLTSLRDSTVSLDPPSYASSSPDDTFEFRKKKLLPGAFDDSAASDEDDDMEDASQTEKSFLEDSLAASPSESGIDEPSEVQAGTGGVEDRSLVIRDDDMDMAGSFPQPELHERRSLLGLSQQDMDVLGTPKRLEFSVTGDWADDLQRTISPRKQDRQALRENQAYMSNDSVSERNETPKVKVASIGTGKDLATSIDLMNSIFGKEQARKSLTGLKQSSKGKGFEWPYPKRSKLDESNMDESDRNFHDSLKPSWGPGSILLYSKPSQLPQRNDQSTQTSDTLVRQQDTISSEGREIAVAKLVAPTADLLPETLRKQRSNTTIEQDEDGVPFAEAQHVPLKDIASEVQHNSPRERSVWELAAILFDPLDLAVLTDLPTNGAEGFSDRIRKVILASFWEKICQPGARDAASAASNAEERAIAYLSANKIVDACDALTKGKDYRLAILMSQLPSDRSMREDIANQLNQWRDLKALSEMTEPIRALYELLTGNACFCEGKKGPAEDIARHFVMSERFGLDWKRAFGLRLWYSILPEDPLEIAVQKFKQDLQSDQHQERKKPVPWFVEEKVPRDWQDPSPSSREDLLWGLLKLYALSDAPPLADIVGPLNATGNPLNARLSFQLYHALALRFPQANNGKGDQLTWDFAIQLESSGEWLWALFATLHLSEPEQRERAIQSLLAHHVDAITDAEFQTITTEFLIPTSWIWEAKALLARSREDAVGEVQYLLRAENWKEAHSVLCRTVGPRAIIEQDYGILQDLLQGFEAAGRQQIEGWEEGGQVYLDFVDLVQENLEDETEVLRELLSALPAMADSEVEFEQRVAVAEMSAVVGRKALEAEDKEIQKAKVLDLPMTDEVGLESTLELSFEHYKAVMAGGR